MKFWEKVFFLHIFILGLAFAYLVPPLQKPDEHGHFKRAVYLSEGYVFLWNDGKRLPLDKQLADLINNKDLNRLPNHPERKIPLPDLTKPVFAGKEAFEPVLQSEKLMFIWGPLAYVPSAIGIFMARFIHLNAYLTFYAGRTAIFLFSFAFLLWLYRRTQKPYRYILLFVAAMPMTIHQLTAYSYDSVHYLLGFLIFSLLADLIHQKNISIKQLFVFATAMIGFLIAKLSYEPMMLLILAIPWQKINNNKGRYVITVIFWILAVITAYFLLTAPTYISSLTYKANPAGINPLKQAQFILTHPLDYARIFIMSSWELKKFHVQGLIGIFGWLDYSLDWWLYGAYILVAAFLTLKAVIPNKQSMSLRQIMFILGLIFLNYAFIMTVFYLNWKPVGSGRIDGTQGRYFIVFVPFFLLAAAELMNLYRKKWLKKS